jgi:hypothetical protein
VNQINQYLPVITFILAGIVWFLRLEGKVKAQEKEIQAFSQIMGKLSEIAERLSFIEGRMRADGKE